MDDIHIWLLATQIVGLSIIAMFGAYVLLQFCDFKKIGAKKREQEAAKDALLKAAIETINKMSEEAQKLNEAIREFSSVIKESEIMVEPIIDKTETSV